MNLYLSLSTQQKLRICHFDVSVDIFDSHHSSQRVIDELVEWHLSGIRHYRFDRRLATLWLTDEKIHHKKQDQLSLCTYHCEEAAPFLVELIECTEEALFVLWLSRRTGNGIGGSGNAGASH